MNGSLVNVRKVRQQWSSGENLGLLGDVAKVFDVGLQPPVPFVLVEQWMLVEEARVETAHVMVTFHAAVHNGLITLLPDAFACNFLVDPVRISPHTRIDLPKFDRRACVIGNGFFERRVEIAVVEEDVGVVEPAIEVTLN